MDYLSNYEKIALIVSHNVGFLNNVCSHILNIENKMITMYKYLEIDLDNDEIINAVAESTLDVDEVFEDDQIATMGYTEVYLGSHGKLHSE